MYKKSKEHLSFVLCLPWDTGIIQDRVIYRIFFFIVNVNSIGSVSAIEAKGCLEVKCMVDTIYTLAQQYVIHMGATENAILIWRYLKYTDREVTIFK